MNKEQLQVVLDSHVKWLRGDFSGSRANLYRADLSGANLSGANLYRADLSGANLSGANLSGANLYGADLSRADLSSANLSSANLSGANLSGANLSGANLSGANLSRANLSSANLSRANLYRAGLSGANLSGADLSGANLYGADLSRANLYGADLSGAKGIEDTYLKRLQIVPEHGSFLAYKKAYTNGRSVVVSLEIPDDAVRVGGVLGRKCRASKAVVLGFFDTKGEPLVDVTEAASGHDHLFKYQLGAVVEPANIFSPSMVEECAAGIHFFITFDEAAEY